ncbi:MAG: thiamine phosphate synthase [Planctomycetota bacterium]
MRLPPTLVALSPGTLEEVPGAAARAAFERAARAAWKGGLRGLLLREPGLADRAFLDLARALRRVFEGGWLGLHDRVHLVDAAGADGAHVGGRSLPVGAARAVVGSDVCLSVSTHAGDGPAVWSGADATFHAPVFAPCSKEAPGPELGRDGLAAFTSTCEVPVWALGGVTAERVPRLAGAGVAGAAAIGGVWGTGPEPLAIDPGPLADLDGIEARSRALDAAAHEAFGEVRR